MATWLKLGSKSNTAKPITKNGATAEEQQIIDRVNRLVKTNGTPEQERIKRLILDKCLASELENVRRLNEN
ncbi:hypothetical protein [Rhodobacter capsulatus]|uniref:hypothetical protein n=1 Tax=Rhodobacter capsulatus TaxID=1061 RepID=UPI004026BF39